VVNISNGAVIVNADGDIRDAISRTLLELGYPESPDSIESKLKNTAYTKAKSYLSCIRGRLRLVRSRLQLN